MVSIDDYLESNAAALKACLVAADDLAANCCVPGRGPRMDRLHQGLEEIEAELPDVGDRPTGERLVTQIERVGALVGELQVTCCAPSRMPLYSTILEQLMNVQRSVKSATGIAH